MSQTELVAALGITFQQVQKYEKGSNRISAGRLFEIAHLLEVPITFFFEGAPQPQTGPLHGAREGNPRRRLMSAFPGKRPNLVARQNDAVEPIPPLASATTLPRLRRAEQRLGVLASCRYCGGDLSMMVVDSIDSLFHQRFMIGNLRLFRKFWRD
jgi:transcriptional regulator with XRE-family HTH domain